ncbi:hypothetical protein FJZ53_05925 [Candidatus Woesearchaeota archaeon]|nr:hypothetical protein [Candidatus Woesearchaeota archaeon]
MGIGESRVYSESEWNAYIKKKNKTEHDYFIFSIRMILYGIGTVLFTLFLLVKLRIKMETPHYILVLLLALSLVFIDKIIRYGEKFLFPEG